MAEAGRDSQELLHRYGQALDHARVIATGNKWTGGASHRRIASGRDLALVAGAGTGKTSTLISMGAATPGRGMYVAFNRAIADDARGRFGPNVECRTAHSLPRRQTRAASDRSFAGRGAQDASAAGTSDVM